MSPRVVLVGMPGSGKSTIGRRLAKILGVAFADSDELVESATGTTVAQLFAERGETAFRALEAAAVIAALEEFDGVLSLGGGAVLDPATRAAVKASRVPVALLDAPLAVLARRVGDARTRPLLRGNPRERLQTLAGVRGPLYAEVATLTLDTARRTPGQAAASLAARLHELGARA
jgi:shikimate kinase